MCGLLGRRERLCRGLERHREGLRSRCEILLVVGVGLSLPALGSVLQRSKIVGDDWKMKRMRGCCSGIAIVEVDSV